MNPIMHFLDMEAKYSNEIIGCFNGSVLYGGPDREPVRKIEQGTASFYFVNTDTTTAALISRSNKKGLLNFASYLKPGGGFLNGRVAQEESLCYESYLYNILSSLDTFYTWNSFERNDGLYTNRAIYTPKVRFFRGNRETRCDVITCAAPNKKEARVNGVSTDRNDEVLIERIKFIRDIAEEQNIESLILGAFGCGVFGQDPDDVAEAIKFVFHRTNVKNVVLAVPGDDRNAEAFRSRFKEIMVPGKEKK